MEKLPELYFLGNRTYVQGLTVFRYAFEKVQEDLGLASAADLLVKRFKQIAEVNTPINVIPEQPESPGEAANATLAVTAAGQDFNYNIFPKPGSLSRVADIHYRQTDYREEGSQEASITLPYFEDFWEIITETVQLTKMFHINKYNVGDKKYRFMVGGFEKLRYVDPVSKDPLKINCRITNHALIKGTIYNMTLIHIKSGSLDFFFNLPFIGKSVSQ